MLGRASDCCASTRSWPHAVDSETLAKGRWVPWHFEGLRFVKGQWQPGRWVPGHYNPKEEPMLTAFLLAIVLLVLIAGLAG
jgi:hypothetical protein